MWINSKAENKKISLKLCNINIIALNEVVNRKLRDSIWNKWKNTAREPSLFAYNYLFTRYSNLKIEYIIINLRR